MQFGNKSPPDYRGNLRCFWLLQFDTIQKAASSFVGVSSDRWWYAVRSWLVYISVTCGGGVEMGAIIYYFCVKSLWIVYS